MSHIEPVYAKVFKSLFDGSLRGKSHEILVFVNMLATCDPDGICDRHPRAIAEDIGLTIEQTKESITLLLSPDPESRSPAEDGRRVVLLDEHRDWGYRIVNHAFYRALQSNEMKRAYNRERQQKFRDALACENPDAARVYEMYPRKVARSVVVPKIEAAIAKHGLEKIESQVKAFAAEWSKRPRSELHWCPQPATWFNQERFLDPVEPYIRENGKPQQSVNRNIGNANENVVFKKGKNVVSV